MASSGEPGIRQATDHAHGPGTSPETWDFQTPYLRAYFGKQDAPMPPIGLPAPTATA